MNDSEDKRREVQQPSRPEVVVAGSLPPQHHVMSAGQATKVMDSCEQRIKELEVLVNDAGDLIDMGDGCVEAFRARTVELEAERDRYREVLQMDDDETVEDLARDTADLLAEWPHHLNKYRNLKAENRRLRKLLREATAYIDGETYGYDCDTDQLGPDEVLRDIRAALKE